MVVFCAALDDAAATRAYILVALDSNAILALPASFGSGDRCGTQEALRSECFTAQLCAYGVRGPAVLRADHAFLAVRGGKSVGVVGVQVKTEPSEHVSVVSLCVDAGERGSRVGHDLMALVGHVFAGIRTSVLVAVRGTSAGSHRAQTVIDERLPKLLQFYGRIGFRKLGTVPFGGGEAMELVAPDGVQAALPQLRIFSAGTARGRRRSTVCDARGAHDPRRVSDVPPEIRPVSHSGIVSVPGAARPPGAEGRPRASSIVAMEGLAASHGVQGPRAPASSWSGSRSPWRSALQLFQNASGSWRAGSGSARAWRR